MMMAPIQTGPICRARGVLAHLSALVLALLGAGCVSRTSYPVDWSARGQGSGAEHQAVSGTYRNRGEIVDAKGGRHPVLLSDLLGVALEEQAHVISDRLNALGQGVAAGSEREVVVLEIGDRVELPLQRWVPVRYRRDWERGREFSGKFLPDLRYFRWRVPPRNFRQAECFRLSDGGVNVILVNGQGWTVRLRLRRAIDGSLVGQLKDEAGGMFSVIPYYSYHDSWVRFEPAPVP